MRKKTGARQLENPTSRLADEVREEAGEYVATSEGQPVAAILPPVEGDAAATRRREVERTLAAMKCLADEIGAAWDAPQSALEILDEGRG